MSKVLRTDRQREIMNLVLSAADRGQALTVGEIRTALADPPTIWAISCSLKFLERAGQIQRNYNGRRREVLPTPEGYAWFRGVLP